MDNHDQHRLFFVQGMLIQFIEQLDNAPEVLKKAYLIFSRVRDYDSCLIYFFERLIGGQGLRYDNYRDLANLVLTEEEYATLLAVYRMFARQGQLPEEEEQRQRDNEIAQAEYENNRLRARHEAALRFEAEHAVYTQWRLGSPYVETTMDDGTVHREYHLTS
jgi:hypothetical protein